MSNERKWSRSLEPETAPQSACCLRRLSVTRRSEQLSSHVHRGIRCPPRGKAGSRGRLWTWRQIAGGYPRQSPTSARTSAPSMSATLEAAYGDEPSSTPALSENWPPSTSDASRPSSQSICSTTSRTPRSFDLCDEVKTLLDDGGVLITADPCITPQQSRLERRITLMDRGKHVDHRKSMRISYGSASITPPIRVGSGHARIPNTGTTMIAWNGPQERSAVAWAKVDAGRIRPAARV